MAPSPAIMNWKPAKYLPIKYRDFSESNFLSVSESFDVSCFVKPKTFKSP